MTITKYNKLCVALCEKLQEKTNGGHLNGETLKFYRDREHRIGFIKAKSYAEAWEKLRLARECVGM